MQANKPVLVIIAGLAGVGKTTLAKELTRRTGFTLCEKDTQTRPLVERLLIALNSDLKGQDRDTDLYFKETRPYEYQCLLDAAFLNLDLGNSVIIDAPLGDEFNNAHWRRQIEERCLQIASEPAICYYVWVQISEATRRQRLIHRNEARDKRKLETWEAAHAVNDNGPSFVQPCLIVENKDGDFEKCLDEILRYIGYSAETAQLRQRTF